MVSGCESFTSSSMFPSCINWLGIIILLTSRFWEYVAMSSLDVHFCWNWLAPACRAKPILGREPWIPSQNDLWWRPVSHCGKGPHSVADHRSDPIPLSTELLWLLLYGIAIILDWCQNCFTALFVSGLSFGMYKFTCFPFHCPWSLSQGTQEWSPLANGWLGANSGLLAQWEGPWCFHPGIWWWLWSIIKFCHQIHEELVFTETASVTLSREPHKFMTNQKAMFQKTVDNFRNTVHSPWMMECKSYLSFNAFGSSSVVSYVPWTKFKFILLVSRWAKRGSNENQHVVYSLGPCHDRVKTVERLYFSVERLYFSVERLYFSVVPVPPQIHQIFGKLLLIYFFQTKHPARCNSIIFGRPPLLWLQTILDHFGNCLFFPTWFWNYERNIKNIWTILSCHRKIKNHRLFTCQSTNHGAPKRGCQCVSRSQGTCWKSPSIAWACFGCSCRFGTGEGHNETPPPTNTLLRVVFVGTKHHDDTCQLSSEQFVLVISCLVSIQYPKILLCTLYLFWWLLQG